MRRPLAAVLAAAGLVVWLVAVAGLVVTPARADDGPETLAGAVLRWGLNTESNTAAHNPGTYNFLMAGALPDPGRGGQTVPEGQWQQRSGDVAVEKWDARSSAWTDATWAGLRTDSAGVPLQVGVSSNHQLVFSRGAGTLDRAAGTARIAWQGSATVAFYSGFSFFHLSDPVLEVADGRGTLTATLGGFASAQDDPTRWEAAPAATVTVATLPSVSLTGNGFTVDPAYRGVTFDPVTGAQVRSGAYWGSFPAPWVRFMEMLGTGPFWYSSGGSDDAHKVAAPVTVSFDGAAVVVPTPTVATSQPPVVSNSAPPPPRSSPRPTPTSPTTAAATPPDLVVPPVGAAPPAPEPVAALPRPATDLRLAAAPAAPGAAAPTDDRTWPWWAGGALLLLAAAAFVVPPPVRGLR
ncbi:hypothetical protein [Nocardioides daeguensis]|uniref:Htaa domain-containing protein n=1 Tax=Nocardioides daeguensis TaxID=908359 RepID=A0ABP6W8G6_9ACTN|nr:hypothetical protein [Nocardioides daeguensis]MBV6727867.1 hypothetical protein [Nocardioides daeguensis]MCR1775338.1 hypothetical protein [Nocardioides daeguensis]